MLQSRDLREAPFSKDIAEGPKDVRSYWVHAEDNVRLRIAHWRQNQRANGTVFLFQGRTENLEKYGRTANEIIKTGYDAFSIDWRGQGNSDRLTKDRMMGHVGRYSDYQMDVSAMMIAAHSLDLPKPWFLIGHSLGACIGLRALIDGLPIAACAFTAPLWDINLSPVQRLAAKPLSWAAKAVGKGHNYAPGTRGESYVLNTSFENNRLTNDPEMYQYYIKVSEGLVDHQTGGPSMQWLYQTLKETGQLKKLESPKIPCITFCGAQDDVVSIKAVKDRMERWTDGRLELVKNAKHDVLYEIPAIRMALFADIFDFFERSAA